MADPLSVLHEEDVAKLTGELIRIPSENPPGEEEAVADFVAEYLRELGLSVEYYECLPKRPNVIGRLKGSTGGPKLMFNGHLDVVPVADPTRWSFKPFSGAVKDGRILGRGATDMKGGLAAMLSATRVLVEQNVPLQGELLITGVMDEESYGLGATSLVDAGTRADMAVIGEPTDLAIMIAQKGILWLEITTRGVSGHASQMGSSGGPVNAIYKMGKVLSALEEHLDALKQRKDELLGSASVSVGTISGGVKINVVPDACTVEVDRRIIPGEEAEKAKTEIDDLLRSLAASDPDLRAETKVLFHREPAHIPESAGIVGICQRAVKAVTGAEGRVGGFTASTDMNILMNRGGIPTVILGPGRLQQAHGTDEFVESSQVLAAAKIYTKIALDALTG